MNFFGDFQTTFYYWPAKYALHSLLVRKENVNIGPTRILDGYATSFFQVIDIGYVYTNFGRRKAGPNFLPCVPEIFLQQSQV